MSVSRSIDSAADKQPAPHTRAQVPTQRPDTSRPRVGNPWRHAPELTAARS
jgi:hypothetical protein